MPRTRQKVTVGGGWVVSNLRLEFRQRPIGAIRRSLATSYDVGQRHWLSPNQMSRNRNAPTHSPAPCTWRERGNFGVLAKKSEKRTCQYCLMKSLLRIKTLLISMELVEAPRSSYQFRSYQPIRSAVMRIKVLCSENFDRSFGTMSQFQFGNFQRNRGAVFVKLQT